MFIFSFLADSSKSQGQQGKARRKDAQEPKSSDAGIQGGGGFAGLASLKARLEDVATPIRNADDVGLIHQKLALAT